MKIIWNVYTLWKFISQSETVDIQSVSSASLMLTGKLLLSATRLIDFVMLLSVFGPKPEIKRLGSVDRDEEIKFTESMWFTVITTWIRLPDY